MPQFLQNLPHLIMAAIVIAAAVILASTHVITGNDGVILIGAAGGFSLGAGAGSTSPTVATPAVSVHSTSDGGSTATVAAAPTATPTA